MQINIVSMLNNRSRLKCDLNNLNKGVVKNMMTIFAVAKETKDDKAREHKPEEEVNKKKFRQVTILQKQPAGERNSHDDTNQHPSAHHPFPAPQLPNTPQQQLVADAPFPYSDLRMVRLMAELTLWHLHVLTYFQLMCYPLQYTVFMHKLDTTAALTQGQQYSTVLQTYAAFLLSTFLSPHFYLVFTNYYFSPALWKRKGKNTLQFAKPDGKLMILPLKLSGACRRPRHAQLYERVISGAFYDKVIFIFRLSSHFYPDYDAFLKSISSHKAYFHQNLIFFSFIFILYCNLYLYF